MNKFKNKGMGIVYSFVVIFVHAIGHWLTEEYMHDVEFHKFVVNFKSMVFNYFNSSIPLKVTIFVSAFMLFMIIVSCVWKYD